MSKKKKPKEKQEPKNSPQPPVIENEEKPFDFGGLPAINLKKNLGCG